MDISLSSLRASASLEMKMRGSCLPWPFKSLTMPSIPVQMSSLTSGKRPLTFREALVLVCRGHFQHRERVL